MTQKKMNFGRSMLVLVGCSGAMIFGQACAPAPGPATSVTPAAQSAQLQSVAAPQGLSQAPAAPLTKMPSSITVPAATPASAKAPATSQPVAQQPSSAAPMCNNPITLICGGQTSLVCPGQSFTCSGNGGGAPASSPAASASPTMSAPAQQAAAPTPPPVPQLSPGELNTGIGIFLNTLYHGLFNRAPDVGGFRYWVQQNASGVGCKTIAASFLLSSEMMTLRNAAMVPSDFQNKQSYIIGLYQGLLGRQFDQGGFNYWLSATYFDGFPINSLDQSFLAGTEFRSHCAVLGLAY
jgi:hypothetical protein